MDATRLDKDEEPLELPLHGWRVTQCCVDYAFTINLWRQEGSYSIRIEGDFTLFASKDAVMQNIEIGDIRGLAPALEVFGSTVDRAVVHKSGKMHIYFSNGMSISIDPGVEFEAWTVTGPLGFLVVSLPGGGIATWQSGRP